MELATQNASWQWAITIDGTFIAGIAVITEPSSYNGDRGWFSGWAGEALTSGFQIRPLFDLFNRLKADGPYNELRAWIHVNSPVEERFAKSFGFRLDCGPASGISPSGQDMNLWKWSRSHE